MLVVTQMQVRLPFWLRRSLPLASAQQTHHILSAHDLNTVCESALCPNRSECYAQNTATFMLLGNVCTRSCGFCAIETGKPETVSDSEPERVAQAVIRLGLKYVVLTSVARDDLKDEGAGHFAETIRAIRSKVSHIKVEVLTPDFHARPELISKVVEAEPTVFNHNVETVPRLQRLIRPQASFDRSLEVLSTVKKLSTKINTKSGFMLGLGESLDEVRQSAAELYDSGCDILTIGQYLRPSAQNLEVVKFIEPQVFKDLELEFRGYGFKEVFSGPYVRSSYHAGETFLNLQTSNQGEDGNG